jgi:hypothetical protein
MYRIFILESRTLVMLSEGPFDTYEAADRFASAEVGAPYTIMRVNASTASIPDKTGWMRVYLDGKLINTTPVRDFKCTDGSYGLLDSLKDAHISNWQDLAHQLEAEAMGLFSVEEDAMFRYLGYSFVYVPA